MKLTINGKQYRAMRDTFWRRKIVSKLYLCLCFEMRGSRNEIRQDTKIPQLAYIAFCYDLWFAMKVLVFVQTWKKKSLKSLGDGLVDLKDFR